MEEELDVVIHAHTEIVQVLGEETACEEARQVIQALMVLVNRGMTVSTPDVVTAISMVKTMKSTSLSPFTKKKSSRIILVNLFVSKP